MEYKLKYNSFVFITHLWKQQATLMARNTFKFLEDYWFWSAGPSYHLVWVKCQFVICTLSYCAVTFT